MHAKMVGSSRVRSALGEEEVLLRKII